MRSPSVRPGLITALLLGSLELRAQWNGQGEAALALQDTVTVYAEAEGPGTLAMLLKGEGVSAPGPSRKFERRLGRVKVEFLSLDGKRWKSRIGWVEESALYPSFVFPCSCAQSCWPFAEKGRDLVWNRCFQEAVVAAERTLEASPAPDGKVIVQTKIGQAAPDGSRQGTPTPSSGPGGS